MGCSGYLGDGTPRTYSSEILYTPLGGMSKEKFGTDTAIYNKLFYNSRGQLAEIREGTSYTGPTDTGWERGAIINFYAGCWGMCGGHNSTANMAGNNGNLQRQEIYIPNGPTFAQTFAYDSLNRLQRVTEDSSWQQEYFYDRYGNRTIHQTNTWGTGINKKDFTVTTANNRLGVPGGQGGTMSYDNAGNLTVDTYSAAAVLRAYDAENRMTSETQAGSYVAGSYVYNADGQRVRRTVGGVTTWQVYGMDGELLAEYAANASYTTPQKEYGYRNAQLLVTAVPSSAGQVSWTNIVGVSAAGNSLTKTGANGWNAGAASTQTIASGDGYMQFTATETNTHRLAGLSNGDSNQSWDDVDFWIYLKADGTVDIGQGANTMASVGNYVTGDVFRVAVEGGVVKYRKNGALLYTSAVTPTYPLLVDTSLYSNGATLTNVVLSIGGTTWASMQWLVTDQLGTPRMVFDQSGSLASTRRHDYLPFGEELLVGTGGRTMTQGYTGDSLRQKFTQKERDNETGLDFFEARYFASTQGRFTSPDPLVSSGKPLIPQSWNRYTYCINAPLVLVDPTGLDWGVTQWYDKNGNHHTNYHWFNGKIGKYDGRMYMPVDFGKAGFRDIVTDDGQIVRISNTGLIREVRYNPPGNITINGQDRVNAAAGNFDGTLPFGREIREAVLGPGGVDTDSPEYKNASMIGEGVVQGSLFFMGGPLEGAGKEGAEGAAKVIEDAANVGRRFGPDQDALIQLAKEAKRTGATPEQAKTLINWAKEYGVKPARGPEAHPGRPFGSQPHIHVGPVHHIPVKP